MQGVKFGGLAIFRKSTKFKIRQNLFQFIVQCRLVQSWLFWSIYERKDPCVCVCSTPLKKETEQVNECLRQVLMTARKKRSPARGSYNDHTLL